MTESTAHADLNESWKYFYSFTLPRYELKDTPGISIFGTPGAKMQRLEPGNPGGQLYSVWKTPVWELGDFGLGVGLYFITRMTFAAVVFLAAILNLYSYQYYRSDAYSGGQPGIRSDLQGSAVCTAQELVCLDVKCRKTAYKNNCQVSFTQGIMDLVCTGMLIILFFFLARWQQKIGAEFDESEQTAQDYAIEVLDPDDDAKDPEEWRRFFSRFGHVTYVTVALSNGELLKALAEYRKTRLMLKYEHEETGGLVHEVSFRAGNSMKLVKKLSEYQMVSPEPKENTEQKQSFFQAHKSFFQFFGLGLGVEYWENKLAQIEEHIENLKLKKQNPDAAKIFVIFEDEKSQRKCLETLSTGWLPSLFEYGKIPKKYRFRGENVLDVIEPSEPTSILWENLDVPFKVQLQWQLIGYSGSIIFILVFAEIINVVSAISLGLAALMISVSNVVLAPIMLWLSQKECHQTYEQQQKSLMLKLAGVRWMNTAFIIYATSSHNQVLSLSTLGQIQSVLWADALTKPIIQLLDPIGFANRRIFAPYCKTQEKMDSYFMGTEWSLAERYTDMTKTLFVSLFYSALLPQGLFITVLAMALSYWVDKYCLLRVWRTGPMIDDQITQTSRGHIVLALLIHIVITLHMYSGFPFDGICPTEDLVSSSIASSKKVKDKRIYKYCEQGSGLFSSSFLFISPDSHMTSDQQFLVKIYSYSAVVMFTVLVVVYFGQNLINFYNMLFIGSYSPRGQPQSEQFSDVEDIQAYIPQIDDPTFPFPLLCCDLTHLNRSHISWVGDYDKYNLYCTEHLSDMSEADRQKYFTIVRHYSRGDEPDMSEYESQNDESKDDTEKGEREIQMKKFLGGL